MLACPAIPCASLPRPAPLPNLRDAMTRRALLFGPVEADPLSASPRGLWHALGDLARRVVDTLTPPRPIA